MFLIESQPHRYCWRADRRRARISADVEDQAERDQLASAGTVTGSSKTETVTEVGSVEPQELAHTAIYARLNTKAVDRALQAQADKLCSLVQEPVVLPAMAHDPQPAA